MAGVDLPTFHGIIGRSAAMQLLFRRIERVAPIDVPVLIKGESGTGKELVARAIQRLSSRRERRFEIVNCGALPRELLLSELFGHERGAFTSAVVRKVGLLAVANAGTLFLDEIGELPLEAQAMLLRFLQQGEVRPVGATETARVNVRLIAATHRDLEMMKVRGSFREDLYYRLRRVVLEVPPLRARREDIPLLVEHIRRRINDRYSLHIEGVARSALAAIEGAPWSGNVRELEAVVEQAMIFKGRGWVTLPDLELPAQRLGRDALTRVANSTDELLNWCQEEALAIAAMGLGVCRGDLMARCRISRESARRQLTSLVARGLLRRVGRGRSTRYMPVSAISYRRHSDETMGSSETSGMGVQVGEVD
jgi:two-component system, NtrC family, response regulator HydG